MTPNAADVRSQMITRNSSTSSQPSKPLSWFDAFCDDITQTSSRGVVQYRLKRRQSLMDPGSDPRASLMDPGSGRPVSPMGLGCERRE